MSAFGSMDIELSKLLKDKENGIKEHSDTRQG